MDAKQVLQIFAQILHLDPSPMPQYLQTQLQFPFNVLHLWQKVNEHSFLGHETKNGFFFRFP